MLGTGGPIPRDAVETDVQWALLHAAGRIIDEWTLVKAGVGYRDLGYGTGRGAVPRRKFREFLACERAHNECITIRRQQDEAARGNG